MCITNKLQQLFDVLHSMQGRDMNFIALQLQQCIDDCISIQKIHMELPSWFSGQRRLRVINARKNMASWNGSVDVRIVDEVGCWNIGVQNEIKFLTEDGVFDNQE